MCCTLVQLVGFLFLENCHLQGGGATHRPENMVCIHLKRIGHVFFCCTVNHWDFSSLAFFSNGSYLINGKEKKQPPDARKIPTYDLRMSRKMLYQLSYR